MKLSFSAVYSWVQRRRFIVLTIVLLIMILSSMAIRHVPFDDTLDLMLPDDSEIQTATRLLRDADLAGKVVVWLNAENPLITEPELLNAATVLAESLEEQTLVIERVVTGAGSGDMLADVQYFAQNMPRFVDREQLNAINERLTPDQVNKQLRRLYVALMKPQGSFAAGMMRYDPLGIANEVLKRIQALSTSFGYKVVVRDGHLVSPDGRHLMMIVETPIRVTDNAGSIQLITQLTEQFAKLPAGVDARIICGHLHTVSNQRIVQQDIRRTALVAALAFCLIFLLCFRDLRAIFIFLIPAVSVLTSIIVAGLFMGPLALLIVGLGAFIAGIAVDYGIHVYVAIRRSGNAPSVVRGVALPICLGAFTTLSVFFAFLFSRISGYRQLGCISIISILLSLGYALFILPLLIRRNRAMIMPSRRASQDRFSRKGRLGIVGVFILLFAIAVVLSFRIHFNSDVAELDGTSNSIIETEMAFFEKWGGGVAKQGLFSITHTNYDEMLELNDRIFRAVDAYVRSNEFINFASIWPAPSVQQARVENWNTFWKTGSLGIARALINQEGQDYSFAADAFSPFFEETCEYAEPLDEPSDNALFDTLKDRFIQPVANGWRMVSFFPDRKEYTDALALAAADDDSCFILSRKVLYADFSKAMSKEIFRITLIAVVLIVGVTFVSMKRACLAGLALTPAISGVMGMLSTMVLLDHPLNAANLIAGVVVIGLCIDYGIFVVFACRERNAQGTGQAITLSAATTLAGAGVLLLAEHPALYSVGLTLCAGIITGYLVAMIVVPALYSIADPKGANASS